MTTTRLSTSILLLGISFAVFFEIPKTSAGLYEPRFDKIMDKLDRVITELSVEATRQLIPKCVRLLKEKNPTGTLKCWKRLIGQLSNRFNTSLAEGMVEDLICDSFEGNVESINPLLQLIATNVEAFKPFAQSAYKTLIREMNDYQQFQIRQLSLKTFSPTHTFRTVKFIMNQEGNASQFVQSLFPKSALSIILGRPVLLRNAYSKRLLYGPDKNIATTGEEPGNSTGPGFLWKFQGDFENWGKEWANWELFSILSQDGKKKVDLRRDEGLELVNVTASRSQFLVRLYGEDQIIIQHVDRGLRTVGFSGNDTVVPTLVISKDLKPLEEEPSVRWTVESMEL